MAKQLAMDLIEETLVELDTAAGAASLSSAAANSLQLDRVESIWQFLSQNYPAHRALNLCQDRPRLPRHLETRSHALKEELCRLRYDHGQM